MILCKEQLVSQHRLSILQQYRGNFTDDVGVSSAPLSRKVFSKSHFLENGDYKTMSPLELTEMLEEVDDIDSRVLLLDLRDSRQYQNGHIVGASSANCTSRLMSRKTVIDWKKKSEMEDIDLFVLYDQQSDLPAVSSPQMLLINYLKEEQKEIVFLQGGYDEFKKICNPKFIESSIPKEKLESYQYSPTNAFVINSEDVLKATASRILPFIFLGNERDSADLDILTELGITHILNVTSISPFYFKNQSRFQYRRLPANDNHMQNLRTLYDEAFDFIDDARRCGGRVLVHCWAGVSRSPSIVIAYILKHSNLNVFETLQFIQQQRSVVGPNINFLGQLERYYADLNQNLEKRSVDLFSNDLRY